MSGSSPWDPWAAPPLFEELVSGSACRTTHLDGSKRRPRPEVRDAPECHIHKSNVNTRKASTRNVE